MVINLAWPVSALVASPSAELAHIQAKIPVNRNNGYESAASPRYRPVSRSYSTPKTNQ